MNSPFYIKVLLFARFLLKFYLQWHFHIFPEHGKPYINQICVWITFDWPLAKGTSCSSKTLIWVQTLSGIKSSHKKFSVCNSKYKNWRELFWPGLKLKIFYKFLLYIKPRYICCHLHQQINKKTSVRISRAWSPQKPWYLIGWLRENSLNSSLNFPEARQVR